MRFLTTIAFAACFSASGLAANASVGWCFPLPFTGGWGAGYALAPAYAGYHGGYGGHNNYGGYAPFNRGMYAAGYGGYSPYGSSCCQSPCSSCNIGCSTGCGSSYGGSSYGGSSCGAACSGSVTSDKVPGPVRDPGFRDGNDRAPRPFEDNRDGDSDKKWERGSDRDDYDRDRINDDEDERPRRETPDFLRNRNESPDRESENHFDRALPDDSNVDNVDDDFGLDRDPNRTAPAFDGGIDDGPIDDFDTRKPDLSAPMDDSDDNVRIDSDIVVPPADPEAALETRLYRGVLTGRQARTNHSEVPSRFRLASQRRPQQRRSARLSGRHNKQSRPLKWIGAPATSGRVRL